MVLAERSLIVYLYFPLAKWVRGVFDVIGLVIDKIMQFLLLEVGGCG